MKHLSKSIVNALYNYANIRYTIDHCKREIENTKVGYEKRYYTIGIERLKEALNTVITACIEKK